MSINILYLSALKAINLEKIHLDSSRDRFKMNFNE